MTTPTTPEDDVTAVPSTNHQLELESREYSTGFTCTSADAPRMSVMRFDRDGSHHTTIALHDVSDLKVDYEAGLFGPTITLKVGHERVTINLYNAKG